MERRRHAIDCKLIENVDVSFASDTYTVAEDGTVEVELTLSADLGRDVIVPITVVNQDGATDQPTTPPSPAEVTITAGETTKSFVITPVDDSVDDDDESVKLTLRHAAREPEPRHDHGDRGHHRRQRRPAGGGQLPPGHPRRRRGRRPDGDGEPDRRPGAHGGGPPDGDGPGRGLQRRLFAALPDSVTFESGEIPPRTFTFTATDDAIDDDGEKVLLEFGTLPDGVTPGTVPTSTVSIIDDDAPPRRWP